MEDDVSKDCRVLLDLMRRFWGSFGRQMSNELDQYGVNVTQYMAIVALSGVGEATMSTLARQLHVTMGATTNVVDKLIRGGYVTRSRDTDDRRVVRVKLEPKALQALQEIEERAANFVAGVLKELEPDRRKQFIEGYRRLVGITEAKGITEARE